MFGSSRIIGCMSAPSWHQVGMGAEASRAWSHFESVGIVALRRNAARDAHIGLQLLLILMKAGFAQRWFVKEATPLLQTLVEKRQLKPSTSLILVVGLAASCCRQAMIFLPGGAVRFGIAARNGRF